jgi:hypothetical protein
MEVLPGRKAKVLKEKKFLAGFQGGRKKQEAYYTICVCNLALNCVQYLIF